MSELEQKVVSEMEKLGYKIEKEVRVGNRVADIIVKTSSGITLVIEVKNRKVGIPDVLYTASMAHDLSGTVTSISGNLVTTVKPSSPIWEVAAKNNIAIIDVRDPNDWPLRVNFLKLIAEIEVLGVKLSGLKRGEPISFKEIVKNLQIDKIIDDNLYNETINIWEVRNKIVHGHDLISQSVLKDKIEIAKNLLDTLEKAIRK